MYLINDRVVGTTSLYFSSDSVTTPVGCALGEEFLFGSDVRVNFLADQRGTTVGFDKFIVVMYQLLVLHQC